MSNLKFSGVSDLQGAKIAIFPVDLDGYNSAAQPVINYCVVFWCRTYTIKQS